MGLPTEELPPPTYSEATSASSPSLSRYATTSSPFSPDGRGTIGTALSRSTTTTTTTATLGGDGGAIRQFNSSSSSSSSSSSPLTNHLRTLPARLRASHQARQTAQAALELDLVGVLAPHVEAFLGHEEVVYGLGGNGGSAVAELTLVPASAVPRGAGLSGAVERRAEGEIVRAARVDVARALRVLHGFADEKKKGSGGNSLDDGYDDDDDDDNGGMLDGSIRQRQRSAGGSGRDDNNNNNKNKNGSALRQEIIAEFEDWGRFDSGEGGHAGHDAAWDGGGGESWWFGDEGMAKRLAAYMRPEPDLERKRVQARVVESRTPMPSKEKKPSGLARWGLGFGSGRRKSAETASSGPLPSPISPVHPAPSPGPPAAVVGEEDPIMMTVKAEEVTFRWENDFGLWESKTGWGIVVTLRMRP
ncbi:hypothetical protein VTH82DRAFT_7000 [Thermothelomyces myriococcoides]